MKRRNRQERCVWMEEFIGMKRCQHGQIIRSVLSDGCDNKIVLFTVQIMYCQH